jgi:L-lactate dehydrogenase complex protein LldF
VERAGGHVHWARDEAEAQRIVVGLVQATGAREVVKVKSLTTDEIRLNDALAAAGIAAVETDLAELICQLAGESPSHILVPAIHKNRVEIRDLFRGALGLPDLSDEPAELAEAARRHLRRKFLEARVALSGANFAVAETGTVCVVESEGNGRFCTTLPETLVTVLGLEKLVPAPEDLEVFLQLLPRSSTGERMNPYTSLWTGVTPGDGPQDFHLVLLDNGRTDVLADEVGRQTLACIRCSACLNVCPVYSRTGGHAYGSVYPGPIGAILTPQLRGVGEAASLPYASSLCGACYEVCPVKIDIPQVLVHLRGRVVAENERTADPERLAMRTLAWTLSDARRYERAQRLARVGQRPFVHDGLIERLPGLGAWTGTRDLRPVARRTFREWWRSRK